MAPRARGLTKSVHSAENRVLRNLMVKARESASLTQQKLADRLGKHQSFVAKYENGERRLDVIEYLTIIRAIGADPIKVLKALIRTVG